MNVRTDIVKMYKEVHSWVGIFSGFCLFIAFYAGAITMFEQPLQRWASAHVVLPAPISLTRTPELLDKVLKAHPEAAKNYSVNVRIDEDRPARVSWKVGRRGEQSTFYAALRSDGTLAVVRQDPALVAEFVNMLHQKVGLPLPRAVALPIMGIIALLYAIAIVSGIVVLLPSLVKDLFALRLGRNLKRMWLDVHNLLGLFSLPFHIVMAVTSVGFAYFPYWYQAQQVAFGSHDIHEHHNTAPTAPPLPPAELAARAEAEAQRLEVAEINYRREQGGDLEVRVVGPMFGRAVLNGTEASADIDPTTGRITEAEFMPDRRDTIGGFAVNYISLHFGNFGGDAVRWLYLLLGLAGAALFYTGNLLWIETRRRKERKAGLPEQTRSTRILGALTVGVPLGCVAGISATIAAAKLLGPAATAGVNSAVYYSVFALFVAYALVRGAARSGVELTAAVAVATLAIPIAGFADGASWYRNAGFMIDIAALALAGTLIWTMRAARRRAKFGNRDSVWAAVPNN